MSAVFSTSPKARAGSEPGCTFIVQTVGTLLSRSYQAGPALIGAIFGTGTNGAYIDHTRTVKKLGAKAIAEAEAGGEHAGEFMVVNTEWGAMDNGVSVGKGQVACSSPFSETRATGVTVRQQTRPRIHQPVSIRLLLSVAVFTP